MKHYTNKFFCFSPEVMLGTFFIEIVLAVIVVFRYKLHTAGRLSVALLFSLAVFQLAEYNVCQGGLVDPIWASRIGYVAITMLPPLGVHLAYTIAGAKRRLLLPAYLAAGLFITFFLFVGHSLTGNACMGNYVIFQVAPASLGLYTIYYYGLLAITMWLCFKLAQGQKPRIKNALYGLGMGYLAFIVPTTAANIIDPATTAGIPSIMCGFAVLLALTLVCWVLPNAGTKR